MGIEWSIVLIVIASYLIGSVNGSLVVSKFFLKTDIREYGSGNAGTTNTLRVMGKKWAAVVTLFDLLKGALAVILGHYLTVGLDAATLGKLTAGVFCIVGHIFPLYFKFKGGKGVMTALAIVAFVDWRVAAICLSLFVVVVLITRWVSLGSILAVTGVPICMYLFNRENERDILILTVLSAVITVILVIMHRENIKRILAGTERRFSLKGRAMLDTVKKKTAEALRNTARRIKKRQRRRKGRKAGKHKLRRQRKLSRRRAKRRARKSGGAQKKTRAAL